MKIRLLYFHRAREAAGRSSETADLPARATSTDALAWAVNQHPALAPIRSILRVAINEEYAPIDRPLADGDTVAFLPPISGG